MLGTPLVQVCAKASPFEAFPGVWECYRTLEQCHCSLPNTQDPMLNTRCSMLDARCTHGKCSSAHPPATSQAQRTRAISRRMRLNSSMLVRGSLLAIPFHIQFGRGLRKACAPRWIPLIRCVFGEAYPNIAKTTIPDPQQQAASMGMGMSRALSMDEDFTTPVHFLYLLPSGLRSCTSLPQERRCERETPYRVSSPSACARGSPPSNSARAALGRYQVCMTHPADNLDLHRLNTGRAWALSWLLQPRISPPYPQTRPSPLLADQALPFHIPHCSRPSHSLYRVPQYTPDPL